MILDDFQMTNIVNEIHEFEHLKQKTNDENIGYNWLTKLLLVS